MERSVDAARCHGEIVKDDGPKANRRPIQSSPLRRKKSAKAWVQYKDGAASLQRAFRGDAESGSCELVCTPKKGGQMLRSQERGSIRRRRSWRSLSTTGCGRFRARRSPSERCAICIRTSSRSGGRMSLKHIAQTACSCNGKEISPSPVARAYLHDGWCRLLMRSRDARSEQSRCAMRSRWRGSS